MSEKNEAQRAAERKAVTEAALEEQAKAPKRRRRTKEQKLQEKMEQEKQQALERHRKAVAEETKAQEAKEAEEAKTAKVTEEPAADQALEADVEAMEAPEEPEEKSKLPNPIEGLNLEPNLETAGLNKYMEQLLVLSRAETRAIQALAFQLNGMECKLESMKDQIKNMGRFERAVGFAYAGSGKWSSPKRIKPCWHCKENQGKVSLQINRYDNKWMVICETCWTRSEGADGPMQAIKYWNDEKESQLSEMVNVPLGS